jgi:hypothetical protein
VEYLEFYQVIKKTPVLIPSWNLIAWTAEHLQNVWFWIYYCYDESSLVNSLNDLYVQKMKTFYFEAANIKEEWHYFLSSFLKT